VKSEKWEERQAFSEGRLPIIHFSFFTFLYVKKLTSNPYNVSGYNSFVMAQSAV
jgi:hypothetical protein